MNATGRLRFTMSELLQPLVCSLTNEECMMGVCRECPKPEAINRFFDELEEEDSVSFYQWTTTDRSEMVLHTQDLEEFKDKVKEFIPKIITHHYVFKEQSNFLAQLRNDLPLSKFMIVQVDFGQNYSFVVQDAVQGFHWNNSQATIHPFVCQQYDPVKEKVVLRTYMIVSDDMEHSATSFHVFRQAFIVKLNEDIAEGKFSMPEKLLYVSDGAASQYKNYKNFVNIVSHQTEFGINCEWHFTATSHGKSTCDAMCAVVKRATRLESLKPGIVIANSRQMFEFLVKTNLKEKLSFIFVR